MLKRCTLMVAIALGEAALLPLLGEGSDRSVASPKGALLEEIAARDEAADAAVAAIRTPEELKAKQAAWRAWSKNAKKLVPTPTRQE